MVVDCGRKADGPSSTGGHQRQRREVGVTWFGDKMGVQRRLVVGYGLMTLDVIIIC
jgi:hypothetical protein